MPRSCADHLQDVKRLATLIQKKYRVGKAELDRHHHIWYVNDRFCRLAVRAADRTSIEHAVIGQVCNLLRAPHASLRQRSVLLGNGLTNRGHNVELLLTIW